MTSAAGTQGTRDQAHPLYRYYVLAVLLSVYIFNFLDRTIMSIVGQPMKVELKLTDWQLGLLNGIAFAVFYVIMGIPVARLAERRSRVRIIQLLIVVWSGMTALCGYCQNFGQLMLARVGVGVGEGGCSPASLSMIADYFPPRQRNVAMSIYAMGIPIGTLLGALLGGWIGQHYGWRNAFKIVGLPGLLFALLMFTIKEPPRGRFDPVAVGSMPSLGATMRRLSRPSFVHVALGASLATFGNYGVSTFAVPFLLRGYDINLGQAALWYGLITGPTAILGTAMGGWLTYRLGGINARWNAYVPAIGVSLSVPFYIITMMQPNLTMMALLALVPSVIHYFYLGPSYAMTSNLVEPRMRATASAILLLLMNFIGLGLGPTLVGALSDVFASHVFAGGSFIASCPGGVASAAAGGAAHAACRLASFTGVKYGMMIAVLFYLWAALHYVLAARTLPTDLKHLTAHKDC